MLKRKNLIILAAVLAVLVADQPGAATRPRPRAPRGGSSTALVAGEFSRDTIGKIVIGRGARAEAVVLDGGARAAGR